MKLAIVIPAYNEEKTISEILAKIPERISGIKKIVKIVVNDNSGDNTATKAKDAGAIVVTHRLNLGAGGATLTGIIAAKRLGADLVVTLDGDGQHNPREIPRLVKEYQKNNADLIIGSRFMSDSISKMPGLKNFGNRVMNAITFLFSGKKVTDSQSGFRLFGKRIIKNIDKFITTSGYEFCSETIMNTRRLGMTISEVPITTIYFDERKGQNPLNGVNILIRLFYKTITG